MDERASEVAREAKEGPTPEGRAQEGAGPPVTRYERGALALLHLVQAKDVLQSLAQKASVARTKEERERQLGRVEKYVHAIPSMRDAARTACEACVELLHKSKYEQGLLNLVTALRAGDEPDHECTSMAINFVRWSGYLDVAGED